MIRGFCDARFAPVRDAFAANFEEHDELGAAVSVRVGGRCVVDLHGGYADPGRTREWQVDTLVNAYSVGKGILSTLVLILLERGQVRLDRRVCEVWPEFAAEGKGDVTLRMLLAHRGGLPAVRIRLPEGAMFDWTGMCRALAAQAPYWEPGRYHGYHVNTFGFLVGEILRRSTGRRVDALLREHVTGPLAVDFHYGLPRSMHARVAHMCVPDVSLDGPEQWARAFPPTGDADHDRMIWHTYFNPSGLSGMGTVNTSAWRASLIPSTSGHATAHAVAAIYDAVLQRGVGGTLWFGDGWLSQATTPHSDGPDRVLGRPSRFGLGFQLSQPTRPIGAHGSGFGHYGYGGSLGFADPDAGVAFGYLTNRPGERWQTPRTQRLIDALYGCL